MGWFALRPAVWTAASAAAAAVAIAEAVPRRETRAALLGIAAALLGGRLDLLQKQIVVGPLDRNLLTDELLDRLERQGARLVDETDRLAARARAGGAADAVHVCLLYTSPSPRD